MFVVNTTSATVMARLARRAPRNRVPSSRRRNPGTSLRSATGYGFFGVVAGALGAAVPVAGALLGAGVSGTPAAPPGDDTGAGAVCAGCVNAWSSTDLGARCRVDTIESTSDRNR